MSSNVLHNFNTDQFQVDLIEWYQANKRDLPWRKNQDPYRIWVSEIMLQQTRVDTVIPYYNRFMDLFPTVRDLAEADTEAVLKAWEGLGYYSRARNLQAAARQVVDIYDGVIPAHPKLLGDLKGIGPYTKGAIMSIAFNEAEPAVDGNVMRVMSRILNISDDIAEVKTRKLFEQIVGEVISKTDPSSFNQGLMELGALVCTPQSPLCLFCPVQEHCRAFENGIQSELPVKSKAKKKKTIHLIALLVQNDHGQVLIEKRPEEGLLASLWQFPMVEMKKLNEQVIKEEMLKEFGVELMITEEQGRLKHVFTHLIWQIKIFKAVSTTEILTDERIRFVNVSELGQYPFPVSHQKMMPYLE